MHEHFSCKNCRDQNNCLTDSHGQCTVLLRCQEMCLFSFLLCLDWNFSQDIQSSCHSKGKNKTCCQKMNNTEHTEEPVVWLPHYIYCCKMGYLWCIPKLSFSALLSFCPRGSWTMTICSCWMLFFHNVGTPVSKLDSCHLSSETLLIILSSHLWWLFTAYPCLLLKDFNIKRCRVDSFVLAGSINNASSYLEDMYNNSCIVCGFAYVAWQITTYCILRSCGVGKKNYVVHGY